LISNIYEYITKKNNSVENNDKKIDMNVDDASFNHFKTLTPLEQKGVLNLMTHKSLQLINE
jgi:hypothetical protein